MEGIKLCGDPHCEAVFHNIPKEVTHCSDCNGRLISINEDTWSQKYSSWHFQYDYHTGEYYRPETKAEAPQLKLFD